jgi:hypothetical protein
VDAVARPRSPRVLHRRSASCERCKHPSADLARRRAVVALRVQPCFPRRRRHGSDRDRCRMAPTAVSLRVPRGRRSGSVARVGLAGPPIGWRQVLRAVRAVRCRRDHRCSYEVQNDGVSIKSRPRPRRRFSGARLDLRDGVARAGDELSFAVVNRGTRELSAGAGSGFERRTAFVWWPQHIARAFVAVGLPISPGERTREMSAEVPDGFRPGRYRLATTVTLINADGLPLRDRVVRRARRRL